MMTRLQTEFQRLYRLPSAAVTTESGGAHPSLTRALVLELARPADWGLLGAVWRGVQADLSLPAPGIAVNGTDGLQLWFSLREPVSRLRGHAWLEALRARYLGAVARQRIALMPGVNPSADTLMAGHAAWVPALQADSGNWSAFLAQDLAPIFEEAPWLDIPPGDEAQAHLLAGLACISAEKFSAAEALLGANAAPAVAPGPEAPGPKVPGPALPAAEVPAVEVPAPGVAPGVTAGARLAAAGNPGPTDPRSFLLCVMNDPAQPMALRIEAAKALLPWSG